MTTHRILIHPSFGRGGYTYSVSLDPGSSPVIERSRSPLTDAARFLSSHGAADDDVVEMYREGRTSPDMSGKIGSLRLKTVRENDQVGPKWVRFDPAPTPAF